MGALIRKELRAYFLSVMGYVVPCVFLFLAGMAFSYMVNSASQEFMTQSQDLNVTEQIIRPLFGNFMRFLFLIILPLMTMRAFAEEKRLGTLELLFTYPVTDWQLVLSKLIGAFCAVFLVMLPALVYPLLLQTMGGVRIEWPVIATGYLGTFLLTLTFICMGLWTSSITDSQVVAVALTFGLMLLFWLAGILQNFTTNYQLGQVFQQLSILEHYDNFYKGIIDSSDVLYYLSVSGFFLFLTLKALESRKWRG